MHMEFLPRAALISLFSLVCAACAPANPTTVAGPTPARIETSVAFSEVRKATGAGQWYPADPQELANMVDGFLKQANLGGAPAAEPIAIIVPHAGYIYSGQVAAYAYKKIEGIKYDTVVVIGDTHTGRGRSDIAVYAKGAFETPLGRVPIDEEVAQALVASSEKIEFERNAFVGEHPVENQLPFLQRVCEGLRIVPIVINKPTLENAQLLSEALVKALRGKKPLIVGSTDLSHYHPYEEARRIDEIALRAILSLDPEKVLDSPQECARAGIPNVRITMCSQGAVLTTILTAKALGANRATVLKYANSGDTPYGGRDRVVGYGAVMIWQGEEGTNYFALPTPTPSSGGALTNEEQETLLALARRTLEQFLNQGTVPEFTPTSPALLRKQGAFVTLEKDGRLRGCIGHMEADQPLYLTVQKMALAAALQDPRFPPVKAQELPELEIEISVLSPLRQIASPEEIEIGRHGVLLQAQGRQAVFLPQVAPEQGWDREEMLRHLCMKAGLPEDAWRDAKLFVFTAQVFREGKRGN